jgi:hypothetical protein
VPTTLEPGWQNLKKRIEAGDDITPHLSKSVDKLLYKDSMLSDWGVHHFHLGEVLSGKLVDRTGPLLFAIVTEEIFYAIGVFSHGAWTDKKVVETIHRNWAAVVAKHRRDDMLSVGRITESECLALRKKHVNALVETGDGTVYMPLGGGVTSSGHNIRAIVQTDRQRAQQ